MVQKVWCVYLLQCRDGSLYTGVSNDINNRMKMHKSGKGSKYVKAKGFGHLIGTVDCSDKIEAMKKEWQIKQMNRLEKLNYFKSL